MSSTAPRAGPRLDAAVEREAPGDRPRAIDPLAQRVKRIQQCAPHVLTSVDAAHRAIVRACAHCGETEAMDLPASLGEIELTPFLVTVEFERAWERWAQAFARDHAACPIGVDPPRPGQPRPASSAAVQRDRDGADDVETAPDPSRSGTPSDAADQREPSTETPRRARPGV